VFISPTLMMQSFTQLVPQLSQVAGMMIGGKKGRDIATRGALLGQILGLADLGKSFVSPSIGKGLGIGDSKSAEAFKKNPEGIFGDALPKGGNFDLPKDMIGGGFGLEMPKGWNTPKTKGIFDPPGKEGIGWIPGLEF